MGAPSAGPGRTREVVKLCEAVRGRKHLAGDEAVRLFTRLAEREFQAQDLDNARVKDDLKREVRGRGVSRPEGESALGVVEGSSFGVELDVSAFRGISDKLGLFEA